LLLALEFDPSWGVAAGIALLTWLLLRRTYFRKRLKTPIESFPRSSRAVATRALQPLKDAPPELLRWQVEMHETARDLKAELDSKISVAQTLVGMAREECERLEAAIERANRLESATHDGSPGRTER
jgi:hypothetical protein